MTQPEHPFEPACTQALTNLSQLANIDAPFAALDLLVERQAIHAANRAPHTSPATYSGWRSGHTRLGHGAFLPSADSPLALNLARISDIEMLPAWLETQDTVPGHSVPGHPQTNSSLWSWLGERTKTLPSERLLDRAITLGLAIAPAAGERAIAPRHCHRTEGRPGLANRTSKAPLVLDLSSLWSGPLCSRLLQRCGAQVIKVESKQRPDGTRSGDPVFFRHIHSNKLSLCLDLPSAEGIAVLKQLIKCADIVIEGSRPRALWQWDIHPEQLIHTQSNLTWVSITAYGRESASAMRIGYGDDAAVASGVSANLFSRLNRWEYLGDALADPITGIHAARLAWESWRQRGSRLIACALAEVVAQDLQGVTDDALLEWHSYERRAYEHKEPTGLSDSTGCAALGQDNERILAALKRSDAAAALRALPT